MVDRCRGLTIIIDNLAAAGENDAAEMVRLSHVECLKEQQAEALSRATNVPLRSWLIRGMNFANAVAKWVASGVPRRTKKEIGARLKICEECPHFVQSHCQLCGCACTNSDELLNKLLWATEQCPIGKWS